MGLEPVIRFQHVDKLFTFYRLYIQTKKALVSPKQYIRKRR
jgi:hypothetical protein